MRDHGYGKGSGRAGCEIQYFSEDKGFDSTKSSRKSLIEQMRNRELVAQLIRSDY